MFWKRETKKKTDYDTTGKIPVIRSSICTGEKVAGFKGKETGRFEDLMVIRDDRDLQNFMKTYGVEEKEIQKEW